MDIANLPEIVLESAASENANIRKAAAVVIGVKGIKEGTPSLLKLLEDKVWQIRESAATALGQLEAEEGVNALTKLLPVDKGDIRKAILDAVTTKGDAPQKKSGGSPFGGGGAKKDEQPWQVKRAAALALSRIKPEYAVEPLLAALESDNVSLQVASIAGLATLEVHSLEDKFIECLGSEEWQVKKGAVTALGKMKSQKCADSLVALLKDPKFPVRVEALIALNHIKPDGVVEFFASSLEEDENIDVRRTAAVALGNTKSPEAVSTLVKALTDRNWQVRKAAVSSLGNLKSKEVADRMIPLLADEYEEVKIATALAYLRLAP